jgi:hypothetical protein
MRDAHLRGNPRGDADGPVDPRRDHAVDPLGVGKALDPALVLRRDDRAPVGKREAGRTGVTVDGDHEEVACPRCLQQPELRGPGP